MTEKEAKKQAKLIFDQFDKQINEAVRGTNIPVEFIAGLINNEAGRDRNGNIKRGATRFEPGVYKKLKAVAEKAGTKYGSIKHSDIADATDQSLRALATSYEATQMMGYWCIVLGCTLADLKNPDKHFFYTVKLLQMNGFPHNATEKQMDAEMRQWNTGRETGRTYHANYVPNAKLIRAAYRDLSENRVSRTINERVDVVDSVVEAPTNGVKVEVEGTNVSVETGSAVQPVKEKVAVVTPKPTKWYSGLGAKIIGAITGNAAFIYVTDKLQELVGVVTNPVFWYVVIGLALIFTLVWIWHEAKENSKKKDRDAELVKLSMEQNSTENNFVQAIPYDEVELYRLKGYKIITTGTSVPQTESLNSQ